MTPFSRALRNGYESLGAREGRILLAVSGGVDSLALLFGTVELRSTLKLDVVVGHVDHGLRATSGQDALAVANAARAQGVECLISREPVTGKAGVEARARERRYGCLEQMRAQVGARWIATAHTATDQAETILMRLMRGSALAGARGIWRQRDTIIRPMLELMRADAAEFVESCRASPIYDEMNDNEQFLRVQVRKRLLPVLRRIGGDGVETRFASFAKWAQDDEALMEEMSHLALQRCRTEGGSIDTLALRSLHPSLARRVLVSILRERAVAADAREISECLQALAERRRATLQRDLILDCRGSTVEIVPAPARRRRRQAGHPAGPS